MWSHSRGLAPISNGSRSGSTRVRGENGALNTEGAIAKYLATEAGNRAADAAIQAHGGYGYTKEYMVEKYKRDVRITTIYEGTSEIMEMTIARDRWQKHLKSRGQHFHQMAETLEAHERATPDAGAGIAALALHALAEIMKRAQAWRLTRNQHILFRLGELVAHGEGAMAMVERAIRAQNNTSYEKTDHRFNANALRLISRIYAREAAQKMAVDGLRWVASSGRMTDQQLAELESATRVSEIHRAQAGLLEDMDRLTEVIYDEVE